MTSTHFDLDDTDDLVIPRPADCSDETWAEIGRLADQRFKALTAKATCPSWCVTEHDVTDPENTIFHRDQEVNVANYKIQLDLDPPTSPEYAGVWVCFDGTMLRPKDAIELGNALIAAANRADVSRATDEELITELEGRPDMAKGTGAPLST